MMKSVTRHRSYTSEMKVVLTFFLYLQKDKFSYFWKKAKLLSVELSLDWRELSVYIYDKKKNLGVNLIYSIDIC